MNENVFSGTGIKKNGQSYFKIEDVLLRASVPECPIDVIVQPWKVSVTSGMSEDWKSGVNVLEGTVRKFSFEGSFVKLRINGVLPMVAYIPRGQALGMGISVGQKIRFSFSKEEVCIL